MTKHSNNDVLQRGIAKLRMAGQTVMEANSLGVMVKATQIDQDIGYINTILMSTMLICSVRYLQYPMMNLVL